MAQASLHSKTTALNQLSKDYDRVNDDFHAEERDNQRNKDCISLMEKEISEQKVEIAALQSTNRDHVKSNRSLLEASKEIHMKIDSLTTERNTSHTELTEANNKLSVVDAKLSDLKTKLAAKEAELVTKEVELVAEKAD